MTFCYVGGVEGGASPVFENDIYEAIDVHTCVDKRNTIGAPGPKAMEQVITINKKWIEKHEG